MIINTYDQLKAAAEAGFDKKKLICIAYHKREKVFGASWRASSPFFSTDPRAAWYNNGAIAFIVSGNKDKNFQLAQIQETIRLKFGIEKWAKNRMRDYVPFEVNEKFPIPKKV